MRQSHKLLLGVALAVWSGTVAHAQNFQDCEKTEIAAIEASLAGAHDLALQAAVQVGDTADYERWFGPYTRRGGDLLRTNLKSVYRAIVTQPIGARCLNGYQESCKGGTYAFVNRNRPFHVNFCPPFFGLPTLSGVAPTSTEMENGTQEGTIIHELSHFEQTANTDDLCYSRSECTEMARTDPTGALRNADSLQYYTEDVILYAAMASSP